MDGKFVVMYSGNLGLCQRLEDIVEAANSLGERDDIVFVLIGEGASKSTLVSRVEQLRLNNIRFLPYQPKEELSASLSAADVHLVPVDPRVVSCLMPSKLYGILAAGRPVLAVAPEHCELAELVNELDVGVVCNPYEPAELAASIERLAMSPDRLVHWGENARRAAVERFDRAISTEAFRQMLESLLRGESADLPVEETAPEAAGSVATASFAPLESAT